MPVTCSDRMIALSAIRLSQPARNEQIRKSRKGPDLDNEFSVHAPAGRFFAGTAIAAKAYPAVDDGRLLATVPAGLAEDSFLRRPRRGLLIASLNPVTLASCQPSSGYRAGMAVD